MIPPAVPSGAAHGAHPQRRTEKGRGTKTEIQVQRPRGHSETLTRTSHLLGRVTYSDESLTRTSPWDSRAPSAARHGDGVPGPPPATDSEEEEGSGEGLGGRRDSSGPGPEKREEPESRERDETRRCDSESLR